MTDHDTRHADGRREEARFTPDEVSVFFEANINIDDYGNRCYPLQCKFIDQWGGHHGMHQLNPESVLFMQPATPELLKALPLIRPLIEADLPKGTNLIVWFALDGGFGEDVVQCDDDPLLFKFSDNPPEWYTEPEPDHEYWLDYVLPEPRINTEEWIELPFEESNDA